MRIIINTTSMTPIYEQIVDCIKSLIIHGEVSEGDILPSVRALSKELSISALTVKKAYDKLEEDGFAVTVHGKGTYIPRLNSELLAEEQKKEFEDALADTVMRGKRLGISDSEIRGMLDIILEEK